MSSFLFQNPFFLAGPRPLKGYVRLWRFGDVDNVFELLMLVTLVALTFIRSTSGDLTNEDSLGNAMQDSELPLCVAATVIALFLTTATFAENRRFQPKSKTALRRAAYQGTVGVDASDGNAEFLRTLSNDDSLKEV